MVVHHIFQEIDKESKNISAIPHAIERWVANSALDIAKGAVCRYEFGWQIKEWYKKDEAEANRLREAIEALKTGSDAAKEFANHLEWCVTNATNFYNED